MAIHSNPVNMYIEGQVNPLSTNIHIQILQTDLYIFAASFTLYELATKNLHLVTIFLQLVAKRRPEDFFNFEPCHWDLKG